MAEERAQRRLTTILAADVVGYSRLMEQDEAGTMALLRARRHDVLMPMVAQHGGRVFKVMGDGVLIEFTSVVNAVECAIDLQKAMQAQNAGIPAEQHILLRIGINLGDVIVEGSDLYGDGVNLAARLESLAEPGGICVSGDVYRQVRSKLQMQFQDLGEQKVKNIVGPVHAYRVQADGAEPARRSRRKLHRSASTLPKKPSIAVLPFANMSGDPEQEYFADGMVEDIITALSRFNQLFVIARNSSFTYKGRAVDVRQVAKELGVHFVLEGSVRKSGQPSPHHRTADRRRDRRPSVGGQIRRRSGGCLRSPGQDHRKRGRGDRADAAQGGDRARTAPAGRKSRRLRSLSARLAARLCLSPG